MRAVIQRDDCLAACFASMLGVTLDELPDIEPEAAARAERWRDWLNAQGWDCIQLSVQALDDSYCRPRGYWIAVHGDRERISRAVSALILGEPFEEEGHPTHAVIYRGSEVVWNPWGVELEPDELGDLLAGIALLPLEARAG